MKVNLSQDQKERCSEVLVKEFMSSESSAEEEMDDGSSRPVMVVKPLPWRSRSAVRVLKRLGRVTDRTKSKQSIKQTLPRVSGEISSRPKPTIFSNNFWGLDSD